jgi:diacylglycerol kinase (ATP)
VKRAFVVLNPVAGRTAAERVRKALQRYLSDKGYELEIYETSGANEVSGLVRQAIERGCSPIIAAGGDGTVSEVVDGLANTDVPLGIIPAGTTNALAQELGLPLNIEWACQVLAREPQIRAIDALRVGQRYFVLSVGTGFDAQAMQATGQKEKRRMGRLAYFLTIGRLILGIQPHVFTVVADGERRRVRAADVLLANISTLTHNIRWGPHIYPDDGQIDICITRASSLLDVAGVLWDILVPRRPRRARNLRYWRAQSSVRVESDEPLPVQGDGDPLGMTPFEVELAPKAVKVLVPPEPFSPWPVINVLKGLETPPVLDELRERVRGKSGMDTGAE